MTLLDYEANGGISDEDIFVIYMSGNQFTIQRIDYHQNVDIPITTFRSVILTQHEEVVDIYTSMSIQGREFLSIQLDSLNGTRIRLTTNL